MFTMKLVFLPLALLATSAFALPPQSATQDMKDAGNSTKDATKKTYKNSKKGVKKGTHKAAKSTENGADKVKDKTAPQ